jgi:ankyrin repeat protein
LAIDNDDIAMVRLLLEHGADPNVRARIPGADNVTPLEKAERYGATEIVAMLEAYGAHA